MNKYNDFRRKVFTTILWPQKRNKLSITYDIFMTIIITVGTLPMIYKETPPWCEYADIVCTIVFLFDYFIRLATADYKFHEHGFKPFLRYPFTPMAIVDLVSLLPALSYLGQGAHFLGIVKAARVMRVFRVFRAARYSRSVRIIVDVFKKSKEPLLAVGTMAVAYVVVSALVVYNVEPDTFTTFFDAVYWATVSLTTMGYGDIYPVTTAGRIITMISSVFGIAIVALPAGIITAGYMKEIDNE